MLPIDPLMVEHRIIEPMIRAMRIQLERIREEDILFRALSVKALSAEHRRLLDELTEEHRKGRQAVRALGEAVQAYRRDEPRALAAIAERLSGLVDFYPRHIEKEDKRFFIPAMDYFSREEKDALITQGYALDSRLFHEQFEDKVRAQAPALR